MVQCMNALADKVQKQDVPCTQWYALHNMATLETCFCSFFDNNLLTKIIIVTRYRPHNCCWCGIHQQQLCVGIINSNYVLDVIHQCTCALMNDVQQPVRSAPSVLPAKNSRSEIAVMLKRTIFRKFPGYWWLFERNTYCIMALGCCLKKKERKKKEE